MFQPLTIGLPRISASKRFITKRINWFSKLNKSFFKGEEVEQIEENENQFAWLVEIIKN